MLSKTTLCLEVLTETTAEKERRIKMQASEKTQMNNRSTWTGGGVVWKGRSTRSKANNFAGSLFQVKRVPMAPFQSLPTCRPTAYSTPLKGPTVIAQAVHKKDHCCSLALVWEKSSLTETGKRWKLPCFRNTVFTRRGAVGIPTASSL